MAGRRKARPIDDPMEGSSKHFVNKKSKPQPKEKSKQSKINFFLQPTSSPVPKPIPKTVSEPQKPKPQPVSHHPNRINTFAAEYFLQNSNIEAILTKMFNEYNMYETKKHRMVAYANEWLHKYIEGPHLKVLDKLTFKSAHTESCVWLLARHPELSSDNKFKQYLQLTNNRHCYVNMRKKNNLLRIEQSIMERDVERHGRKGLNKVQSLSERALKRYNGQFKRDDPVVPLKTDEKVVDVQQVEPEDRSHEQSAVEGIVDVQPAINEQTSVDQNAEQVLINEELDRLKKLSLAEFEQKSNVHELYALLESDSDEETCTLSQFVMIAYKGLLLDQPHLLRYEEPEVIDLDPPNDTKQIIENHTKNTTDIIELDSSDAEASLAEENVPEQTTDMANAQVITPKPILTITEFLNKSSFFSISKTMAELGLFTLNYMAIESFKCFLNGEFIGLTMADKFSLENYDLERSKMVPEEAMLAELTKILEQTSPTEESLKRSNPEPDIESVVNKKARMDESTTQSTTSSVSSVTVINTQMHQLRLTLPTTSTSIAKLQIIPENQTSTDTEVPQLATLDKTIENLTSTEDTAKQTTLTQPEPEQSFNAIPQNRVVSATEPLPMETSSDETAAAAITIKQEKLTLNSESLVNSDVLCCGTQPEIIIEIDDFDRNPPPRQLFQAMMGELDGEQGVLRTIEKGLFLSDESTTFTQTQSTSIISISSSPVDVLSPPQAASLSSDRGSAAKQMKLKPTLRVLPNFLKPNKKIQYESDTPPDNSAVPAAGENELLNMDSSFFISSEVNQCLSTNFIQSSTSTTPSSFTHNFTTTITRQSSNLQRFYQPNVEFLNLTDLYSIAYKNQQRPLDNAERFKVSLVLKQFGVWRIAVHNHHIQQLFSLRHTEWTALLRLLNHFKLFNYTNRNSVVASCNTRRYLFENLLNVYFKTLPRLSVGSLIEFNHSLNYFEDDVRIVENSRAIESAGSFDRGIVSKIDPFILEQMKNAKAKLKKNKN